MVLEVEDMALGAKGPMWESQESSVPAAVMPPNLHPTPAQQPPPRPRISQTDVGSGITQLSSFYKEKSLVLTPDSLK